MSTGLRELLTQDLDEALERVLAPRLTTLLKDRLPGHCARVVDLGVPLAVRLTRRIRSAIGDGGQVHVLGEAPAVPPEVAVSSTKLIELRNPDGQRQRPPLLVFVPPGTRASAEDSFDVATFEQVELGDVYAALAERLLAELPDGLRRGIAELFALLDEQHETWPYADSLARSRYLLTVQRNDHDPAAAGAALFELGLVPDFALFDDPAQIRTRAARNLKQMRILTRTERPERQRVIELDLSDPRFRARLAEFAVRHGLDDPRGWTRRVVVDRANWPLAFQRWPLRDEQPVEAVTITVADLALPRSGDRPEHAEHPILSALSGQLFLNAGRQGASQLPVVFEVDPDPRRVAGLTKFAVHLVSEESGPTGITTSVRVSTTGKREYKATLRKLRTADLEQGWHYVRVQPIDAEGIPLPVHPARDEAHYLNESDRFFVIPDDTLDEPPPQQRVSREPGVVHAARRLEFQARQDGRDRRDVRCRGVGWKTEAGTGRNVLRASFGARAEVEIPLSPALTDIQRGMLAEPGTLGLWRLPVDSDQPGTATAAEQAWPAGGGDELARFRSARGAVFSAVRGEAALVVEACEVLVIRELITEYAEAYGELLDRQLRTAEREDRRASALAELTALLQIDTVTVAFSGPRGARSEVKLVAPTHPLRMLWLLTWSELGHRWIDGAGDSPGHVVAAAGRSHEELSPLGFPLVVPRSGGRLAVAGTDLTPYWGVCLPVGTEDPQGLIDALAAALRVSERGPSGGGVSGRRLADRVERYLRLHPYVRTLVISAVRAGRADHLADMLVDLQSRSGFKDIAYDIRLYSAAPEAVGDGAALAQLLCGEWSTSASAEAFQHRTESGLVPKLAVAVRPLAEFRSAAEAQAAHLTLLFDAFGGVTLDAASAEDSRPVPIHGLSQTMIVKYEAEEDQATWRKRPRHGRAHPLPDAEELSDLLTSLPTLISVASCAVTTGEVGPRMVPQLMLALDAADSALLHQAHSCSDWVLTVDQTLGVEYFDSPSSARRPNYVIDFDGSGTAGLGHQIVISSRSVDELCALLAPAVGQHGLQVAPQHTLTFFGQLRLLSGRLAFKLASAAATQRTEVLGLALARMYLDYQGVLADQILVPLDAHLELYRDLRRRADEVDESVGLRRTDLALFGLDARRRTITCRLVEVKCHTAVGGLSAYQALKDQIAEQLDTSAAVIAEHFDPLRVRPDRPDRVVKNAELVELLGFYLERAVRYRMIKPEAAAEARWFLERLDIGDYRLEFTRTGLIFDLSDEGMSHEVEGGVEYHRIGRDLAKELIEAIPTDPAAPYRRLAAQTLSGLELTLPKLDEAVFRAPARLHETFPDDRPAVAEPMVESAEPQEATAAEPVIVTSSVASDVRVAGGPLTAAGTPDLYLGTTRPSPQYGVLGEAAGKRVALDLNETHTISLFGVQGGGKSYTLGSIIEAASLTAPPVNELPNPLATIVFHYSKTQDYAPEFTSMIGPNTDADQIRTLRERYGVEPAGLADIVMLVPADQLSQRRAEYPGIELQPLTFGSGELRAEHWRFLMGAVGNQSTYIRQLQRIMKANRNDLRLDVIRNAVEQSALSDSLKQLALQRLELAAEYIDDDARVKSLVRPGRMIIVDLRDEYIEKDEALGLFVVLMELFAEARLDGRHFNKLVVFDEAHKYIESPDLVAGLVESVREMRHKGMSVLVASQDPPSVPISLIELSSHVILHKFTSPAWLKHLQKANAALVGLTPAKLAALAPGEAYLWSSRATDPAFTRSAVKIRLRPRITQHGGATRTAMA